MQTRLATCLGGGSLPVREGEPRCLDREWQEQEFLPRGRPGSVAAQPRLAGAGRNDITRGHRSTPEKTTQVRVPQEGKLGKSGDKVSPALKAAGRYP